MPSKLCGISINLEWRGPQLNSHWMQCFVADCFHIVKSSSFMKNPIVCSILSIFITGHRALADLDGMLLLNERSRPVVHYLFTQGCQLWLFEIKSDINVPDWKWCTDCVFSCAEQSHKYRGCNTIQVIKASELMSVKSLFIKPQHCKKTCKYCQVSFCKA